MIRIDRVLSLGDWRDRLGRMMLGVLGLIILSFGVMAGGGSAQAQICPAGSISFAAVGDEQTLDPTACDEFLEDFSIWAGFYELPGVDAYSFSGLGADDFGNPAPEPFSTENANYVFTQSPTTGIYTIELTSLKPGAASSETLTLYMCAGPETNAACVANQATTITVTLPVFVNIITTSLTAATAGESYSATVVAEDGTGPLAFSVSSGALPAGLTLAGDGTLSGTPSEVGTFEFTVQVADSTSTTDTQDLSLTVGAPDLAITTTILPDGMAGTAYSQTLTGSGGTAPYLFAQSGGTLPPGLTLSGTGVLSGLPAAGGSFDFTVTMTDATVGIGAPYSVSQAFTVEIGATSIVLSPGAMLDAMAGVAYSLSLTASGGIAPYSFEITTGVLPAGLSLSSAGVLSGTPTAGGSFSFDVTATDSSAGAGPYTGTQAYTLTVAPAVLDLTPATLAPGEFGVAYSAGLSTTGGTAPYTYSVPTGTLPPGLGLFGNGTISGIPAASGTFNFTVITEDSSTGGGPYQAARTYDLVIAPPSVNVSGLLGGANLYAAYSASLTASGGTGDHSYALTGGSLPSGISLSSEGTLSGTPTEPGTFTFDVTATDSTTSAFGGPFSGTTSLTLVVSAPTVVLPGDSLPDAVRGIAYSYQMPGASAGLAPYVYAVTSGALPPGVSLSSTGLLTGLPSMNGTYVFTVVATDSSTLSGPYTASQTYTLTVVDPLIAPIPTLSEWAMILLAALLGAGSLITLSRRQIRQ